MLSELIKNLPGTPSFERKQSLDINSMSGARKVRIVYKPNPAMRELHIRLLKELSYALQTPQERGVRRSKKRVTSLLKRHRQNRFFYLTDIRAAFDCVNVKILAEIIAPLISIPSEEVVKFLEAYCTSPETGGLITGGPASNILFDIYAHVRIDNPLAEDIIRWGLVYTRYTDDLIFSGKESVGTKKRARIREVIRNAGFTISHHKTHGADSKKSPVFINGYGIRWRRGQNQFFVPGRYLDKVEGLIHLARDGRVSMAVLDGHMSPLVQIKNTQIFITQRERIILQKYRELKRREKLLNT